MEFRLEAFNQIGVIFEVRRPKLNEGVRAHLERSVAVVVHIQEFKSLEM